MLKNDLKVSIDKYVVPPASDNSTTSLNSLGMVSYLNSVNLIILKKHADAVCFIECKFSRGFLVLRVLLILIIIQVTKKGKALF